MAWKPASDGALTVAEFCTSHKFTRQHFYNLRKRGKAPKSFTVGRRRLIAIEEARAWRKRMTVKEMLRKRATKKASQTAHAATEVTTA